MNQKFVTIHTGVLIVPIDMVRAALESEGILCDIKGYDTSRPNLSFGMGIELKVPEKDREKAKEIIKELNKR